MATNNSIFCPYCHERTSLNIRAQHTIDSAHLQYQIGECNGCNGCVLVLRPSDPYRTTSDKPISIIYPHPLPVSVSDIVPENIRIDMSEAKLCLSISAFRGAATLARRTLQVICMEKGAKKEKLADQIDELSEKNIITDEIKKWAHEIRYVGNDAAHPNDALVTKEDAEEILELLDSLCDVLYIAPSKAEKRREARESKKEDK